MKILFLTDQEIERLGFLVKNSVFKHGGHTNTAGVSASQANDLMNLISRTKDSVFTEAKEKAYCRTREVAHARRVAKAALEID